jgi:hypothetical protein
MDKKTIKAILDVIKDVSDRPGLYGAEINGKYIYFTDGYVVVRLEMGAYENLRPFPDAHNVWVSGEQFKEIYKGLGTREVCLTVKDDDSQAKKNEGRLLHPDWIELWKRWSDAEPIAEAVPIRPDTFKKLAPFGDMLMQLTENKMGQKLVAFNGKGINAFACPLARF